MMPHQFQELAATLAFRDWRYIVDCDLGGPYLVIEFDEPCNVTGQPATQRSRKWRLSSHMTKSEFTQTALMATIAAMEHEIREQFLYRGKAVYGPHFDVDQLHELCTSGTPDVRPAH
jgi:hypothetical protein